MWVRSVQMGLKKTWGFLRNCKHCWLRWKRWLVWRKPYPTPTAHFLTGEWLTSWPDKYQIDRYFIFMSWEKFTPNSNEDQQGRWQMLTLLEWMPNRFWWQHWDRLLNQLWKHWRDVCLLFLKSAHASDSTTSINPFITHDVTLIYDHLLPWQCWKIGVQQVFTGQDGRVCSCCSAAKPLFGQMTNSVII